MTVDQWVRIVLPSWLLADPNDECVVYPFNVCRYQIGEGMIVVNMQDLYWGMIGIDQGGGIIHRCGEMPHTAIKSCGPQKGVVAHTIRVSDELPPAVLSTPVLNTVYNAGTAVLSQSATNPHQHTSDDGFV